MKFDLTKFRHNIFIIISTYIRKPPNVKTYFVLLDDCSHQVCTTANGPDPGKPCIFPFSFFKYGILWNISCCTTLPSPAGTTEPWCPTMVDESGLFVNQSSWGTCESECYPYGITLSKFNVLFRFFQFSINVLAHSYKQQD